MSVAFSPDGKTLASGSRDRAVKLWDARTGKVRRTLTGPDADMYSVAFSPDGKVLASGSGDKTVRLCDVGTGAPRGTLTGHEDVVRSVAFSPDGKILASDSLDKTLRLWDAATGKLVRTLPGHALKSLAFSPDGQTLVSGGRDKTVQLWDVASGKRRALLEGHSGGIEGVAFSPDGKTAASSSEDGTVRLWDAEKAALRETLRGHGVEVDSLAFSPDGKLLASGSKDKSVKLWEPRTGALRRTLTGASARHESLTFSPDGQTLVSGSGGPEALIRLWNLDEREERFNKDPQWDNYNNRAALPKPRTIRQDFGYSKTNHAGGKIGEIGGFLSPAAEPAYYARKIPDKTFADTLSASGTLACDGRPFHALIGFFNADTLNEWRTPNTIVLRISGRGDVFYAWVEYATRRWRAGGDEPRGFPKRRHPKTGKSEKIGFTAKGAVHRWSLRYDPAANDGGGVVTTTIDDQTAVCHLRQGHKADGARFNRFGLLNVMKSADEGGELWLDDVTIDGQKEDFAKEPGWDAFHNRRTYETRNVRPRFDFGFSPTRYAGGLGEGELGGLVFRGDCRYPERMAYYADRLNVLNLSKPLKASGKVSLRRGVTDSTVLLGFFHAKDSLTVNPSQDSGLPRDFLGIVVDGPSREGFYFAPAYRLHDGGRGHAGDSHGPPHIYPDGKAHNWTLEYSPTAAGGKGRITLTLDRRAVALDLKEGQRAAGAHFDRFGLVTTWVDGNSQHIYFDDLTYTCTQK
jgi:WD40 repeat protein